MASSISNFVSDHQERFLDELFQFLKIPSISTNPQYKGEVENAARFVLAEMNKLGVEARLIETKGHPIVYGELISSPEKPTLLIYGHYDVQPDDPIELWDSPPFDPVVKDGRIYARGSADDKGQMYMYLKALETLKAQDTDLPCNLKFMFEGEEEVGSDNLETFVKENRELLSADVVLISDTSMISSDTPSITVGLKGLSYMEVEVHGPDRDLHSGVYGGAVVNPANALCSMISKLKDENNRITIPGFYDKVEELSEEERSALNEHPFDLDEYKKDLGVEEVDGEVGYNTIERSGIRPTLDVNGIWSGYIGEGAKTVLPAKAQAKISMRLVPNQDHHEITRKFSEYFPTLAPKGVTVKVTAHHGAKPSVNSTDSVYYRAASEAFKEIWGKEPIPTRDGGSIPVVALLKDELKIDTILLGFGLDQDAIHSPNESYKVQHYLKGIETIAAYQEVLAKMYAEAT